MFSSSFFDNYIGIDLLVKAALLFTIYYFISLTSPLAKGIFLFYFLGFIVFLLFLFEYHQYFGFLIFTEISLIFFLCNLCLAFFNYLSLSKPRVTMLLVPTLFFLEKKGFYIYEFFTNYIDAYLFYDLNDLSGVMMLLSYNMLFIFTTFHVLFIMFFMVFRFSAQSIKHSPTNLYEILKSFDTVLNSLFSPSIKKFK